VPLLAIGYGIWGVTHDWHLGVDSAVYRAGSLTLLHGQPLYDTMELSTEPQWAKLPFTYPPAAALIFVPLALLPVQLAWTLITLVFLGRLFVTGRRMDALRGLGTFLLLQGLMFAIAPHDASGYWTATLPDTGRIGPVHWAGNQSLNGLLNRATQLAPWASHA